MAHDATIQKALQDAREGRLDAALSAVRLLVKRQPKDPDALQVLGLLLTQAGEPAQALHHLGRAVTMAPNVAGYRNNYANALMNAGRAADAAAQLRKAVELDPTYARGWLGLALALTESRDAEGAVRAARSGLALRSNWPEMSRALAAALEAADRIDEAVDALVDAVAASPQDAGVRGRLLLALNYASRPAREIFEAHRAYRSVVTAKSEPPTPSADPERALRIGVLSGDLRTHSVGYFAEPFVRAKPAGATLVAFSTSAPAADDPMQRRFRGFFDEWVEAAAMDDATLDRAIRARGIDVLVEMSGHTAHGRLSALDRKPAPVIVHAIGYPNTTGHPAVDWRVVDSTTDPADAGADALCTERLLRLDPCFLCYAPPPDAPEPAMPAVDAPVTFGSFNLTSKVGDETIALWARALAAVPGSRLLVKSKSIADPATHAHLVARLAAGGIDPARVETIAYTKSVAEHLALYARIHVALDTTPYNGTTTTCEALWMGVPVVTLAGDRHAARVGASLLRAVGCDELVARDAEAFASVAASLAQDRARLAEFRGTIRDRMRGSVLLDQASYAARFHAALRGAWREWCASRGA